MAEKGTSRSKHVFLISILHVACYFIAFVSSRCASDRQSGINTGLDLLLANNCRGCRTELRPLGLKIGVSFWRRGLLMEQCNFQAVELTHISLCGTNLPVMNLSGHCGASTNESVFLALLELGGREGGVQGESIVGLLIFQHIHLPDMKKKSVFFACISPG